MRRFSFVACGVGLVALSLGASVPFAGFTAEPTKIQSAREPASCELLIEGTHIEKLTLTNERGESKTVLRPGSKVLLPAGQYVIGETKLQGGFFPYANSASAPPIDRFTLAPGKPCRLRIGAPLTPGVIVKRSGRLLSLDYQLLDGDGRKYRRIGMGASDDSTAPQFAVYKGDQQIGSGTFEYG